ncbi:MAG: rhomboid family intrarane serine protease [Microbacteriaceae bacterium]|nr:rhomboid family intrarane serine protease [Microbacteriaceae bacterium]
MVTYGIIALCVLVFVIELVTGMTGGPVFQGLVFFGPYAETQPWRLVTSVFLHVSILHILFNMFSVFVFGPIMERMLGRARFAALFLLSGIAGSVAVLLIAPTTPVAGASGAIFGLLGAYFVIQRHLGGTNTQLLIVIGLNLVLSFVPGLGIAWQAHVGGLLVGALVGFIFVRTRNRNSRMTQILALGGTAVGLIVLTIIGAAMVTARITG